MRRAAGWWVLVLVMALGGCGDDDGGAGVDGGDVRVDAGPSADAGPSGVDAGPATDAGGTADAGPSADTWDSFAMTWFATFCTDCHDTMTRDYRTIDHVMRDSARIRCGVADTELSGCGTGFPAPRQFPIGTGPRPTDEERRRLVAWLEAGTP